jgi:hypothetical protein
MFGRSKRLTARQKLEAVRTARSKFELAAGNEVEFERLVREDAKVKMIDPAMIMLFIQIAMAVFKYFQDRKASKLSYTELDDQEIFLGSIKFGA